MKIEMPENGKIRIQLNDEDMRELNISFDEMDYSNIETRRVIWTLLDEARRVLNTDIDPAGRMLIEVSPLVTGGCTVHFTVLAQEPGARPRRLLMKRMPKPVIFEFDGADSLLAAAAAVKNRLPCRQRSELYAGGGRYRLIVFPSGTDGAVQAALAEYAERIGEGCVKAAHTREHWRPIAEQRALNALCEHIT